MTFHHPNDIYNDPQGWKPIHDDTVVNDIISNNGRRGGLIRIEPDSEFIRRNPETGNVEASNGWNQQIIY
jgi:hypothetical protein